MSVNSIGYLHLGGNIRNIYILLLLSLSFGTVTDIDGNIYETVQIGDQLWMAENLKVIHFRNGDEIPTGYSDEEWNNLSSSGYTVYPADNDWHAIEACGYDCADVFGNLYNWFAAKDNRGICPEGWNIPTDDEYKILEMNVGMGESEANGTGYRGTNEGSKLAGQAALWREGDLKDDSEFGTSGFNTLAAGFRQTGNGYYLGIRSNGYFWTSSEYNSEKGWFRMFHFSDTDIGRNGAEGPYGFSVRCLQDEITTGCTNPEACNYDESANFDDYSCNMPDCAGVCFGDSYEDDCGTCDDDSSNDCFDYCLDLHYGNNLISFPALPDDASIGNVLSPNIYAVIAEGAASINSNGSWVGSLSEINCNSGYWLIIIESEALCIEDAIPCDTEICLSQGANLVSFPCFECSEITETIPDEVLDCLDGIIGEGVGAVNLGESWVGSLTSLCPEKGYWMKSACDICFSYDCSEPMARQSTGLVQPPYPYNQSTKQAFYFIEEIENIEIGDWILAYNGDNVIGARQWQGSIIDVPAMGNDGSEYTKGYIESGIAPSFKILRGDELINLEGDIPAFENNQLYMVSSLTEAVALPEAFSLDRAYPNPFNPVTTLSFAIPLDSEVSLSVYNLQGREVTTLINANMDAGYHSVVWDANSYASGVYFVKMVAGDYISTQKLMLIK